ncbi:Xylanase inhibitor, C-terminal [Sesbania bispinosa]|nr:Xylanase inhibitor, C-terminal [Sesbania bispinosa]
MDVKNRGISLTTVLLFLLVSAIFSPPFSAANQLLTNKNRKPPVSFHSLVSSTIFPVHGNVHSGYYTVTLNIGNPPKPFELDIDTGSDLTWVECDAPCKGCTKPRNQLYKPHDNIVKCGDPLCAAVKSLPSHHQCTKPNDQCDYEVNYADQGRSRGVLVRDNVPLQSTNGSLLHPMVAFGCGYDQKYPDPPPSIGVLGLGYGKISILSQLHSMGLIRNVVGHCLSVREGGYLFFGDKFIPSSGVVWTPISQQNSSIKFYESGPADLFFNEKPTSVKGLQLIFDSGSTYTYFNPQAYKALVDMVNNDLKGKPLNRTSENETLKVCWKGAKRFRSSQGNVCLGILNASDDDLGNSNIIGDISLQDKMVIYDNERQQIGWVDANCDTLPNS